MEYCDFIIIIIYNNDNNDDDDDNDALLLYKIVPVTACETYFRLTF